MELPTILARSESLHRALAEAVGDVQVDASDYRSSVAMDALQVAVQHGQALRAPMGLDLGTSGVAMLRLQHDAVTRAIWTLWAASERDIAKLAAPLTPATLKAASSLGMAKDLLEDIEASGAPDNLKRSLREIRTSSWAVLNSYVHAGLHPLRRHDTGQQHEMTTSLRLSNGLASITCGLIAIVGRQPARHNDINIACITYLECMPARHTPT